VAERVTGYQEAPFHVQVSSRRVPFAPRPPKRMSWGGSSAASKAIDASSRPGGVAPTGRAEDQEEPFHTQVVSDSWPSLRRPPKTTTVPSASS
jgi:hypothetical protein